MKWSGALIVAGYLALIGVWGWWGALAAAAHIGVILLTVPRR